MQKQSKWLLVGSLMCLVVSSVFHQGYGMKNDDQLIVDEISLEQKAIAAGASQVELKKVKKGFFTYKQIVEGHEHWDKFKETYDLTFLKNAVTNGNEIAICHLIHACLFRWYGLEGDDQEVSRLAEHYADLGSEEAIYYLLNPSLFGYYGVPKNNPEAIALAEYYADQGSEMAICYLLRACRSPYYELRDNPIALDMVEYYADQGSEQAIGHLLNAHEDGWYGLQANKLETLKLAIKYANKRSETAIQHLFTSYESGWYQLLRYSPEGFELTKEYAKKGSKIAISHFLAFYERDNDGVDQQYDPEVFKLVERLAIHGNSRALEIFNNDKDKVKPNFNKRNDKKMPFSDVRFSFNLK